MRLGSFFHKCHKTRRTSFNWKPVIWAIWVLDAPGRWRMASMTRWQGGCWLHALRFSGLPTSLGRMNGIGHLDKDQGGWGGTEAPPQHGRTGIANAQHELVAEFLSLRPLVLTPPC